MCFICSRRYGKHEHVEERNSSNGASGAEKYNMQNGNYSGLQSIAD